VRTGTAAAPPPRPKLAESIGRPLPLPTPGKRHHGAQLLSSAPPGPPYLTNTPPWDPAGGKAHVTAYLRGLITMGHGYRPLPREVPHSFNCLPSLQPPSLPTPPGMLCTPPLCTGSDRRTLTFLFETHKTKPPRPIAVGDTLRRLVAKWLLATAQRRNAATALAPLQTAFAKGSGRWKQQFVGQSRYIIWEC